MNAQPFQTAELGWPNTNTNRNNGFVCLPPTTPDQFNVLPENGTVSNSITVTDPQLGKTLTFLGTAPLHGSMSFISSTNPFVISYTYTATNDYTGADSFVYKTRTTCQGVAYTNAGTVSFLIYDTNSGTGSCRGSSTSNLCVILPTLPDTYEADFWTYSPCFTNHYHHYVSPLFWDWVGFGPVTSPTCFTAPCADTTCAAYTNYPPAGPTNYCGASLTNDINYVHWFVSDNAGTDTRILSQTNGMVTVYNTINVVPPPNNKTRIPKWAYSVCGGPTNRTVLVTGVLTKRPFDAGFYPAMSFAQNISVNNISKTNAPLCNFSGCSTPSCPQTCSIPVSFTYPITMQVSNYIEFEVTETLTMFSGSGTAATFTGTFTNTVQ